MKEKVLFSWSGGKDSASALYELYRAQSYEVVALVTTGSAKCPRTCMHGVRLVLLDWQAKSLGLVLERVTISPDERQEQYEAKMLQILQKYLRMGVSSVAFGDISLEDVREYRESNLSKLGMKGVFPLWKKDTSEVARRFVELDFRAVVTCVDSRVLDRRFVGRLFDRDFLSDLPCHTDPCGENGEFHSFVFDGPMFRERILYRTGKIFLRQNRFYYCDLIPAGPTQTASGGAT
jgi:uncharacterized protein (TIGR00290 family)